MLVFALQSEVELCEEWGNAPPEEGSEHFFAYVLDNNLPQDKKFLHGELVGLGIHLMAQWQGRDLEPILGLMERAGLEWRAGEIGVPEAATTATLQDLPMCAETFGYPYSIINRRARR